MVEPKKSEKSKKASVLADHKQVGKRFIPPFLTSIQLEGVSWRDLIPPELLWLGVLNGQHGFERAMELAVSLAGASYRAHPLPSAPLWFGSTTAYGDLGQEQQAMILESQRSSGNLELLKEALRPFLVLYADCPLRFLLEGAASSKDHIEELKKFKPILATLFDRRGKPAMQMQAIAVHVGLSTGSIEAPKGSYLAKPQGVKDYPDTEESKKTASSVRAGLNGIFGGMLGGKPTRWAEYFWNRGLQLEPCDYATIYGQT